jgi:hypothetical protein
MEVLSKDFQFVVSEIFLKLEIKISRRNKEKPFIVNIISDNMTSIVNKECLGYSYKIFSNTLSRLKQKYN